MDVKTIILGFLSKGEMSGYDIKQAFSNSIGFFYDASFGAIYPALRKLEEEGLVTKQKIIQTGKPNKIVYRITDSGKELFQQEMMSPLLPPILRSDMLVKVFFAANRSKEDQQALFAEGLMLQQKMLMDTRRAYAKVAQKLDPFQTFCWEYTLNHLEMTIKFLEEKTPVPAKQ